MKKIITLAIVLMLSGLLSTIALAGGEADGKPAPPEQAQAAEQAPAAKEDAAASEALQAQQDYLKKREEMKARRDAAIELRNRNIKSNNPGNTGM